MQLELPNGHSPGSCEEDALNDPPVNANNTPPQAQFNPPGMSDLSRRAQGQSSEVYCQPLRPSPAPCHAATTTTSTSSSCRKTCSMKAASSAATPTTCRAGRASMSA